MPDQHHTSSATSEPPIALSHLFHTIGNYRLVIGAAMAVVALACVIVSLIIYLTAPSQRITSQRFRLDFEGAAQRTFPNGTKFSPAEIVSETVLRKVFLANEISRFTSYPAFSHSLFVLESNAAYDLLAAEYQARLSDPKLNAVDRERIQREYELKRDSLNKNEYSLNYLHTSATAEVPDRVVRKVLGDVLSEWANIAANEQHVTLYRVNVLSPQVVNPSPIEQADPVVALHVLRSKTIRVLQNVLAVSKLPAAELARTKRERLSLAEVGMRLEEIIRFRIEPLIPAVRPLVSNPGATIRFVESQLSYDERLLAAARQESEAIRQALAAYTANDTPSFPAVTGTAGGAEPPKPASATRPANGGGDTVMPQLSDSFLDRLVSLTSNAATTEFRQRLVEEYRMAADRAIPLEQAVLYDRRLLEQMTSGGSGAAADPEAVRAQIEAIRAEVRQMIANIDELHRTISRNLLPSSQLYTPEGAPTTRAERTVNLKRLALYSILALLLALPAIIIACLIHNRVREEEQAEAELATT